jgi:plasmid stabilization system protein ParE
VKVRVSKRAQSQIERAAHWWDEHRDLAPQAFDEDIAKAFLPFLLLGAEPLIGTPVPNRKVRGLRRFHLARIHYHFCYRIRRRNVEVIAFWHTSKGTVPSLYPATTTPNPWVSRTHRYMPFHRRASARRAVTSNVRRPNANERR